MHDPPPCNSGRPLPAMVRAERACGAPARRSQKKIRARDGSTYPELIRPSGNCGIKSSLACQEDLA